MAEPLVLWARIHTSALPVSLPKRLPVIPTFINRDTTMDACESSFIDPIKKEMENIIHTLMGGLGIDFCAFV